MIKRLDFDKFMEFVTTLNALRQSLPELAPELDKCIFDAMNNHLPKCGHGTCECQTMNFAQFHAERNLLFGTTSEAQSYEFN